MPTGPKLSIMRFNRANGKVLEDSGLKVPIVQCPIDRKTQSTLFYVVL